MQNQSNRFKLITDIWEKSIEEGRETLTLSDTNLTSATLLDEPGLSPREAKHAPIAKHFTNKIMPKGVVILNDKPTHHSSSSRPEVIDHIITTNPAAITNVTTTIHGESDHSFISLIRHSKAPISQPRYKMIRNYRDIDPLHFHTLLWSSSSLQEATISSDPDQIAELIINGITNALDTVAPLKRIQTKTNNVAYISSKTRALQFQRDAALKLAQDTNLPADWRGYRAIRNRATQSVRNDSYTHIHNKIENSNPTTMWQTVKKLAGNVTKGSPNMITYKGTIITSPREIVTVFNIFYISKVKSIREAIQPSLLDPIFGFQRLVAGKNLTNTLSINPVSRHKLRKIIRAM